MEEKEFIKEHPSLKGKARDPRGELRLNEPNPRPFENWFTEKDIHETQLDKSVVKKAIDDDGMPDEYKKQLKKELRL